MLCLGRRNHVKLQKLTAMVRNAILEYQNEALIQELKTLKQIYEKNTDEQKQNC